MIVTEATLAPFRDQHGRAHFRNQRLCLREHPAISDDIFTATSEVFGWDDYGGRLDSNPQLPNVVLVLAFTKHLPLLTKEREWWALRHITGGRERDEVRMIATPLVVRDDILPALNAIARDGYHAETGHFDRDQMLVSRLVKYANALAALGLDCEATWRHLAEAIYPVDPTVGNLEKLATDSFDVTTCADWGGGPTPVRYSDDPAALFLTLNSR